MTLIFILGIAAIVAGTALIYPPAGLIVAGAIATGIALRLGETE
jgi:hypothetical protein